MQSFLYFFFQVIVININLTNKLYNMAMASIITPTSTDGRKHIGACSVATEILAKCLFILLSVSQTTHICWSHSSAISIEHVIIFVTCWLRRVLGAKPPRNKGITVSQAQVFGEKQLRDRGITKSSIKKKSKEAAKLLQEGRRDVRLEFTATKLVKTDTIVCVVVSLASILTLQKYAVDSLVCQSVCNESVRVGVLVQESENEIERMTANTSRRLVFDDFAPIDSSSAQCFTLPFKSNNLSLLSADAHSRELSTRLARHSTNTDASFAQYFEHSLADTVGNNSLVVNGMDASTLKPERCLNDSIINFWMSWLVTPRSPQDTSSPIHAFSTHFLAGVMTNGYTDSLQRWLKRVNIFEKKLLLFPVHLGHHWSLIAVLNPKLIKQTRARWGSNNYTRNVTCMLRLDSLGCTTIHDGSQLAYAIRLVLNKEWGRHFNTNLDQDSRPFNHRDKACQLHFPQGAYT